MTTEEFFLLSEGSFGSGLIMILLSGALVVAILFPDDVGRIFGTVVDAGLKVVKLRF